MRHLAHSLLAAGTGAALLALAACSHGGDNRKIAISNFTVDETVKSGEQTYIVADSFQTHGFTLQLSVNIQWPEKLGDHSIMPLQDSIKSMLFTRGVAVLPQGGHGNIEQNMRRFLAGKGLVDDEDTMQPIASLAEADSAQQALGWYCHKTGRVVDLQPRYVTYSVVESAYTGGAHPQLTTSVVTFDLDNSRVLTPDNMFKPGSRAEVVKAVTEALARDMDTSPRNLAREGIDTEALATLGQPYIDGDDIVFFFDYYTIAPYYMGTFELPVAAADLQCWLSPEVIALLQPSAQ